jgi:hypothetical protein
VHLEAYDWGRAERASREALESTPPGYRRNQALYNGLLAESLLRQRRVDEAADAMQLALGAVRPGRLLDQLNRVRPELDAYKAEPAIADCLARLDQAM